MGGREKLHGNNGEDFCKEKWGTSSEKKAGSLSGAAARTSKL